jgi:MarR family transcriptional regulator for hemolysin
VTAVQPDPTFSPLGRSIGRAHKFVRAWGDRELAPLGASVTDYILLVQVASAAAPGLSQIEIARFADMGGPALVRHLDRMERDGHVQRTRDAADRRIMRVTLTEAGGDRLRELQVVMARCDAKMRSWLTVEEATVMQGALDKVFELTLAELHVPGAAPAPADPPLTSPPPTSKARSKR